jgi:hypothetical protein
VPVAHAILAEVPAEQHDLAAFRVPGGEVDEPAVEVLDLHSRLLEIGDEEADLLRHLVYRRLSLLNLPRVEPASVPAHLVLDRREALPFLQETLARGDEPADERLDHGQSVIRFLLAEEAHTC